MALLEVRNITKSFGKTDVLKGISFDLNEGNVLSIIGSSGSGKTTLLRCINFLESADRGTISIDGEDVYNAEWDKKQKKLAMRRGCKYFGMVFQNFNLFPQYNVVDNIALAPILHEKELIKAGTSQYPNIKAATEAGYTDIYKTSLLGVGDLEKRLGRKKFNEVLGKYVIKPVGAPTLVPETDPRKPYSDAASDFNQ